jgi:hypothetical protein
MERSYITNDHWYRQRETWWLAAGQDNSRNGEPDGDPASGD